MTWRFDPAAWLAKSRQTPFPLATPATLRLLQGDGSERVAESQGSQPQTAFDNFSTEAEPTVSAAVPDTAVDDPALPALVQAVLDRFPGATITAVRRSLDGKDRDFKPAPDWWTDMPLTYAEASAVVTATLPSPEKMTDYWARRVWREDFGPTRFAWTPPVGGRG